MKLETILHKLCCPFDKSDLDLTIITQDEDKNIIEGILKCADCRRVYPIVSGIPIMTPDQYRETNLEQPLFEKWSQYLGNDKVKEFRLIEQNQVDP